MIPPGEHFRFEGNGTTTFETMENDFSQSLQPAQSIQCQTSFSTSRTVEPELRLPLSAATLFLYN